MAAASSNYECFIAGCSLCCSTSIIAPHSPILRASYVNLGILKSPCPLTLSHGQAGTALFNSSSPAVDLLLLLFSTTFHTGVKRLLVYFNTTLFAALLLVAINQQRTNQRQVYFVAFLLPTNCISKKHRQFCGFLSGINVDVALWLATLLGTHSSRVSRYRASLDEDTNSVFGIFPN